MTVCFLFCAELLGGSGSEPEGSEGGSELGSEGDGEEDGAEGEEDGGLSEIDYDALLAAGSKQRQQRGGGSSGSSSEGSEGEVEEEEEEGQQAGGRSSSEGEDEEEQEEEGEDGEPDQRANAARQGRKRLRGAEARAAVEDEHFKLAELEAFLQQAEAEEEAEGAVAEGELQCCAW